MRLVERLAGGRKAFSEPDFWSLGRPVWAGGTSLNGDEELATDFEGYVEQAYRTAGVVYACVQARMLLFSEARFQWQQLRNGRPGDLFGTDGLSLLEKPWPTGTTGALLSRMESDVSAAGNSYWTTVDSEGRFGAAAAGPTRRMARMRPDHTKILSGSRSGAPDALDAELIGFVYRPKSAPDQEVVLLPNEVCHYAPIPDPMARWRGMSWLTPVLREIEADKAATVHKGRFFRNGATPSLAVSLDKSTSPENFQRFVDLFNLQHKGAENAYKTLFLGGGADVKPLTMDLRQLDFKMTQGGGETRIAAASGVPPVIVGLSEGLQSATYSNYGQARRRFADGTMRPLWREAAGSMQILFPPPTGARLAMDLRDVAFLREDQKDAAEIQGREAATIRQLVDAGYTPDTVVAAVKAQDFSLLKHSGLYSVQLQPPGTTRREEPAPAPVPTPPEEQ